MIFPAPVDNNGIVRALITYSGAVPSSAKTIGGVSLTSTGTLYVVNGAADAVTLTRISATEFRVQSPITGANPRIVCETQFRVNPTSGVWSMYDIYVKDLRGINTDIEMSEPGSVREYAMQIGYTADAYQSGVTYDFYGCGHGHETLTGSLSITVDGVEVGNATSSGSVIIITQAMSIQKPVGTDAGIDIGTGTLVHTINAAGVQVDHTHTITLAGLAYRGAYTGMLPTNNNVFDTCQSGSASAPIRKNGTVALTGQVVGPYKVLNSAAAAKLANPYVMTMTLPYGGPALNKPFSDVTAPKAYFLDNSPYGKWYSNFVGDTIEAITPGSTATCRQIYTMSLQA